jgi:hypothetical protein
VRPGASDQCENVANPAWRPAQAECQAQETRNTRHRNPVRGIHAGGTKPDLNIFRANLRPGDLMELKHLLRLAVFGLNHGAHQTLRRF